MERHCKDRRDADAADGAPNKAARGGSEPSNPDAGIRLDARGRWPDDVALWYLRVPCGEPFAWDRLAPRLTEDERARALRYRRDDDRLRFAAARVALRARLAARTGIAPLDLQFSAGPYGRPLLADHPHLSFNVSHAGDHALIAMSSARCVGVDVEVLDPSLDWRPLLDLVCTGAERRVLDAHAAPLALTGFLRCWTAKEALLKALGLGISRALRELSVDPFDAGVQRPRVASHGAASGAAALQYHWLDEIDGGVGCIAYAAPAASDTSATRPRLPA